jgi:probable phosphoglycerate mutase
VPTRLVLIRHGESASNAGKWLSGIDTCGGLSDLGRLQAERLRDRLAAAGERPDAVLSSTMPRAIQTAEIVTESLGITVEAREELGERSPGECEGMTHEEYAERYGKPPIGRSRCHPVASRPPTSGAGPTPPSRSSRPSTTSARSGSCATAA